MCEKNINTKFILGEAGTAKSSLIIETTEKLDSFVCLAYTHSAVNNLRSKSTKNRDNFKTIHSFFKIKIDEYGNEIFLSSLKMEIPEYIFIDEVSLVPLNIIEYIYNVISNNINLMENQRVNLIFVGDLLQLNPINLNRKLIDYQKLFNINNVKLGFQEAMLIADHLCNNIFSTKFYDNSDKIVLKHNYRSNQNVISILNNVLGDIKNLKNYTIKKQNIYEGKTLCYYRLCH